MEKGYRPPWFRLEIDEVDREMAELTTTQRGLVIQILMEMWRSPRPGQLVQANGEPVTVAGLARAIGVRQRTLEANLPTIVAKTRLIRREIAVPEGRNRREIAAESPDSGNGNGGVLVSDYLMAQWNRYLAKGRGDR